MTVAEFKALPAKNEHELQKQVVRWCAFKGYSRFFAVPNAARRNFRTAGRMRAEGMRAGVPDLVFYGPRGSVLWVEMKNGNKGELSAAQAEMHADLYHCGHTVIVARTFQEATDAITKFYTT